MKSKENWEIQLLLHLKRHTPRPIINEDRLPHALSLRGFVDEHPNIPYQTAQKILYHLERDALIKRAGRCTYRGRKRPNGFILTPLGHIYLDEKTKQVAQ